VAVTIFSTFGSRDIFACNFQDCSFFPRVLVTPLSNHKPRPFPVVDPGNLLFDDPPFYRDPPLEYLLFLSPPFFVDLSFPEKNALPG